MCPSFFEKKSRFTGDAVPVHGVADGSGKPPAFFVLVTDTSTTPAQTGVQTLVRGLIAGLMQLKRPFRLVEWRAEQEGFFLMRPSKNARLGTSGESKFLP